MALARLSVPLPRWRTLSQSGLWKKLSNGKLIWFYKKLDVIWRHCCVDHSTWLLMSQSFTLESIELLRQPKLQIYGKRQKKIYLVGELRRQSPIDWRVYRAQFPKLERSQNTKLFSSFYSKDQFAICWWSQNLNSCMCTTKSSTFELPQLQVLQKKTWQHRKKQTEWCDGIVNRFLHIPFVFCMHRTFNRLSQKR